MGLFGKKELCAVCGQSTAGLAKLRIADGTICPSCRHLCSPLATNLALMHTAQIRDHIQFREQNLERIKSFVATDAVGDYIKINRGSQLWCCPFTDKSNPDLFKFSDVIDYELVEDGDVVTKGGIRSAIVGGVLLGDVGAIVGGTVGKKLHDTVNRMSVNVNIKSNFASKIEIPLIISETKCKSSRYKNSKQIGENIISLLATMVSVAESAPESPYADDPTDQIIKLKGLLDTGVITPDEFTSAKKKILGI